MDIDTTNDTENTSGKGVVSSDMLADQGEELIDFKYWWSSIGSSQRPRTDEDAEEFAKRMCEWAWESAFLTYR